LPRDATNVDVARYGAQFGLTSSEYTDRMGLGTVRLAAQGLRVSAIEGMAREPGVRRHRQRKAAQIPKSQKTQRGRGNLDYLRFAYSHFNRG
jgi:hypothetical protein